jgi:hypothetical protein
MKKALALLPAALILGGCGIQSPPPGSIVGCEKVGYVTSAEGLGGLGLREGVTLYADAQGRVWVYPSCGGVQ